MRVLWYVCMMMMKAAPSVVEAVVEEEALEESIDELLARARYGAQ